MAKKDQPAPEQQPVEDLGTGAEEAQELGTEIEMEELGPAEERIETPALTEAEIERIREQARKEIEAEFKKKLREQALKAEKEKLRTALSMSANDHLNGPLSDLVRITIDIPEFSNVPWITVDMGGATRTYLHGQTYTVPRHVGNSLREMMQHMRRHQNEIDGKKRNRQLTDGRFVDVVTGRVTSKIGTTVKQEAA